VHASTGVDRRRAHGAGREERREKKNYGEKIMINGRRSSRQFYENILYLPPFFRHANNKHHASTVNYYVFYVTSLINIK